jgi:hypothetical protein
MRKWMGLLAFIVLFTINSVAFAADWQVNIHLSRENGSLLSGEMWYNNDMVWRLKIQADGALPAISGNDPRVTVLVPDIVDGLFVLKVHR